MFEVHVHELIISMLGFLKADESMYNVEDGQKISFMVTTVYLWGELHTHCTVSNRLDEASSSSTRPNKGLSLTHALMTQPHALYSMITTMVYFQEKCDP